MVHPTASCDAACRQVLLEAAVFGVAIAIYEALVEYWSVVADEQLWRGMTQTQLGWLQMATGPTSAVFGGLDMQPVTVLCLICLVGALFLRDVVVRASCFVIAAFTWAWSGLALAVYAF